LRVTHDAGPLKRPSKIDKSIISNSALPMSLFDVDATNATVGWQNIRTAGGPTEAWLKSELEKLWRYHEFTADEAFRAEFARQPEPRFWEMYLAAHLVRCHKKLMPRKEIAQCKDGYKGPDFGVRKGNRVIWIETIAPDKGDQNNIDKVPELLPAGTNERFLHVAPRRQVELRITSALYTKALAFRHYRNDGIIGEKDSCIVAISGAQFALQAVTAGLPYVVSAVYPFGEEQFTLESSTLKVLGSDFTFSDTIQRTAKPDEPIPRSAFRGDQFKDISGIVWSRSSVGNFSPIRHDLVYVHNQRAERPVPRGWVRWREEYYSLIETDALRLRRRG
jgi:hypothetical protein